MSQNETVDDLDTQVDTDVATDVDNEQEDDTTSDEITYEQAMKWKKDAESLQKANKKIAMLEKATKKAPEAISPESMPKTEAEYELWAERRDFYKSNANAKDLKEEIEAMVSASKWKLDRQKAFEVLSWDAEIEENRKTYANPIVAGNKSNTVWFTPISIEKYDKLSSKEQADYNAKSKEKNGWVVFK